MFAETNSNDFTQLTFTYPKLRTKNKKKGVKYVQS